MMNHLAERVQYWRNIRPAVADPVPSDISGTTTPVEGLEAAVGRHLLVADNDVLRVTLAAVAAHRLSGDPVWLLLVGPPSGAKTEIISLLNGVPGVFPISEMTARTFASGLKETTDPSLLARVKDNILTLKDFTSALEMHRDDRGVLLGQLRELYDGRFDKVWGTGKELHWRGRLGFIAGVTGVIDKHHGVMAVLGQRFVMLRVRQPDRQDAARRAIENSATPTEAKADLAHAAARLIAGLPPGEPCVPEDHVATIASLADLIACARSGVDRDGYTREITDEPLAEMPPRLGRQLAALARGLALIAHRDEVCANDVRRVIRVGLDSLPPLRRRLLVALRDGSPARVSGLTSTFAVANTAVRRGLEDLVALGLVVRTRGATASADEWSLESRWQPTVDRFVTAVT